MTRNVLAILGLSLLGAAVPARGADRTVTGMIVSRAGGGFWTRFTQPVENGSRVQLYAFREGENVGAGRIEWASPLAPYEAYIVDVKPSDTSYRVSYSTAYMAISGDKFPVRISEGASIVPGYYVVAPVAVRRMVRPVVDPLRATQDLLGARPELGGQAQPLREPGRQRVFVERWLEEARGRKWNDPVTERLVARLAELLRAQGGVGGPVPPGWFPTALAKEKKSETGANP